MAPLETRTTSAPPPRAAASTSTSWRTRAGSMPPAAVVSDEEPTLTTTRRAPETRAARSTARSVLVTAVPVGVVRRADLVGHRPHAGATGPLVRTLAPAVEAAGDVGAGLALVAALHGLVDLAAAPVRRALLVEALVLAAAAQHLGARLDV